MRNRIARYFEYEFPKDEPTNLCGVGFAFGIGLFSAAAIVQLFVFMIVSTWGMIDKFLH